MNNHNNIPFIKFVIIRTKEVKLIVITKKKKFLNMKNKFTNKPEQLKKAYKLSIPYKLTANFDPTRFFY